MTTREFIMKYGLLDPEKTEMLRDLLGVLEQKYSEAYLAQRENQEYEEARGGGRGMLLPQARVGVLVHGDMHIGEMIFHERARA